MSRSRRKDIDFDDDLEDDVDLDSKHNPKVYARFDRSSSSQLGPLFGPFDEFFVNGPVLTGRRGEVTQIIAEFKNGLWHAKTGVAEAGYNGFDIVFDR